MSSYIAMHKDTFQWYLLLVHTFICLLLPI